MKINVLTTATPRTELHRTTLEPTLKVLSEHFKVNLYINLDDVLGVEAFQRSVEYIKTLPTQQTHLMQGEGSFKLAAKKLYESCHPTNTDDLFLWLEDDWVLEKSDEFIEELKSFSKSDNDFIVTTIYDHIGGNPLVFRRKFFDKMREHYLANPTPMDPERILWHVETEIWGGSHSEHKSSWLFLNDVFVDAGRKWRDERGIEKENKRSNVMKTWHIPCEI